MGRHGTPPSDSFTTADVYACSPNGRLPSEARLVKKSAGLRPTITRALRDLQTEGPIERRAEFVVAHQKKL
jgi:DNA-binding transcriptional MocR family regulator